MGLRAMTGYFAHAVLAAYWLWVAGCTAPELRKGNRDRRVRAQVLVLKTSGFVLTALVVGIVHYWATAWWQVLVTLPVAAGLGVLLRRRYRRTVAAPRHRLTIAHRVRTLDLRRRPRPSGPPLHLRPDGTPAFPSTIPPASASAATVVPAAD